METDASFSAKWDLLVWKFPHAVAFLLSILLIATAEKQNEGLEGTLL